MRREDEWGGIMQGLNDLVQSDLVLTPVPQPVQPDFVMTLAGEGVREVPLVLSRETATWLVRYLHQSATLTGVDAYHRHQIVCALESGVREQGFPYKCVDYDTQIDCACGCGVSVQLTHQRVLVFTNPDSGADINGGALWATVILPARYRLCESAVWQAQWAEENADDPNVEPEYLA